jgi:ABC-2 type transport system ATP-binding protein
MRPLSRADRAAVTDALEVVGLSERARDGVSMLSGGQQQRALIARALAGEPDLFFLDEPTAGVDVGGRQVVRRIIRELAEGGTCVLLATHELEEVERVADRVVIVDRGRLLASGTPAELAGRGAGTAISFGAPPGVDTRALTERLGALVTEIAPGEYRVDAAATPGAVATLTAWLAEHDLPLADLRAGRQRLEDVFLRLTEDASHGEGTDAAEEAPSR